MGNQVSQGTLNRLRAHIVIPNFTSLNINPQNMSKEFVRVSFSGDYDMQIDTATGVVTSPEPYVMATIEVGILRTQALGQAWRTQAESLSDLGPVSVFPDTSAFSEYDFQTCVIRHIDPGAFDGNDPVIRLTIGGVYYINNSLWS